MNHLPHSRTAAGSLRKPCHANVAGSTSAGAWKSPKAATSLAFSQMTAIGTSGAADAPCARARENA